MLLFQYADWADNDIHSACLIPYIQYALSASLSEYVRAHKTERFQVADVAISVRRLGLWMKRQLNADNSANQGIPADNQ